MLESSVISTPIGLLEVTGSLLLLAPVLHALYVIDR
jgi:hypothetical protein